MAKRVREWEQCDIDAMNKFYVMKQTNKSLRWADLKLSTYRSKEAIRRKFSNLKLKEKSLRNDAIQILVNLEYNKR